MSSSQLCSHPTPPHPTPPHEKQNGALRRYAAVFGLDVSGTCTRDELTRAIARHWDDQVLSEGDVLFGLAVALRRGDPASPSSYSYAVQEQQQQQQPLQQQPLQQEQQLQPAYQYQQQQAGGGGGAEPGGGGGSAQFQQQPFAQAAGGR